MRISDWSSDVCSSDLMSQLEVSTGDIEQELGGFGTNSAGGFIDQNSQEFLIRNIARPQKLEDLRNTVVDHRGGQPVLPRQVAAIRSEDSRVGTECVSSCRYR